MKLCYIGRVPTNWWPRRVLCALWTRRPIVKVAMGCHTEPAAVAHVLQRLHFFQFFNFFIIYTTYRKKKKITRPYRKKKNNSIFLYNLHDLPQKKITRIYRKKKITRLDDFLYTTYIFHPPPPRPPPPATLHRPPKPCRPQALLNPVGCAAGCRLCCSTQCKCAKPHVHAVRVIRRCECVQK